MKLTLALHLFPLFLSPQFASAQLQASTVVSNFDNLGNSPAALQAIGVYNGLNFKVINLATLGIGGAVLNGFTPESGSNVGAYSARTIALAGGNSPTISRNFDGSTVEYFDLSSFFYACTLATGAGAAGVTFSCTVTVEGFRNSIRVASQPFVFVAKIPGTLPMIQAKLSKDFKKLDYVTFKSSYPIDVLGATAIDSVNHTNYRLKL